MRIWTAATLVMTVMSGCGMPVIGARTASASQATAAKAHDPAKFLAHAEVEAAVSGAFAVQAESQAFVKALPETVGPGRNALVAAIQADKNLLGQVTRLQSMTWDEQLPVLKQVMALECRTMGFTPPPLVIAAGDSRPSFFEFDPARPGTGTVYLYPAALAKETSPQATLLLLIHEVRHSAQFQLAFGSTAKSRTPLANAFKAGFQAQNQLSGKLTFCDFCSLNQEFEAFQSANYVVGKLTGWQIDPVDMGCYSSQYDGHGALKLDLAAVAAKVGLTHLVEAFNTLEMAQFNTLYGQR